MAANKPTAHQLANELSDIPLSLEQGDGNMTAAQVHKAKTSSLKRFFRKSKGQPDETGDVTPKEPASHFKFGMFRKNDEMNNSTKDNASSSSKTTVSESKTRLTERLSTYWSNAFKRVLKKNPDVGGDQGDVAMPAAVSPIEENSIDIQ